MAEFAPMPTVTGPGSSAASITAGEKADVSTLAPLASSWSGPATGVATNQQIGAVSSSSQGNLAKFTGFLGGLATGTGHIAVGAADWLVKNSVKMVEAPGQFGADIGHGLTDRYELTTIDARNTQYNDQITTLNQQFKEGKINSKAYAVGMKALSGDFSDLANESMSVNNRIGLDQKDTVKAAVNTASTLVTVLTAGFGKAASAAVTSDGLVPLDNPASWKAVTDFVNKGVDFMIGENEHIPVEGEIPVTVKYMVGSKMISTTQYFQPVENAVSQIADDSGALKSLPATVGKDLQTGTAEVVAQTTNTMTSGQIARATAANVAFKYPLTYQAISGTGRQLYTELQDKKYGAAVNTTAFNAALLLMGGPLGKMFGRSLGKGTSLLGKAMFGETSYWDELSKYYGDGSVNGFVKAIMNHANTLSDSDAKDFIQTVSDHEATNVAASGGDAKAAAYRTAQGMKNSYGFNLNTVSHEEGLADMVNFSKAQEDADTAGRAAGLGPLTVGRVDARDLQNISNTLQKVPADQRSALWDRLKTSNPTRAWANNDNFDKQVKKIITDNPEAASLDREIKGIEASFKVDGFPEDVAKSLAKRGYIPIKPVNLEAPFVKGSGTLKSATMVARNSDFFMKSVKPLPILGHIGAMLTGMGMSPLAARERVYQMFNDNLADNLGSSRVLKKFSDQLVSDQIAKDTTKTVGQFNENELNKMRQNASDTLIKRLSEYAYQPTRGGLRVGAGQVLRPPIQDLRQLTTKDVLAALPELKDDASLAREVKGAIMDSHLDVALAVKGLGDRVLDLTYKVPGTAKFYRVQGAFRFAWNPVFAAKLAYKTEILTQLKESHFPTILGTNTILSRVFPEYYDQLDEIRGALRGAGVFDEKGNITNVIGGEGVNDVGGISKANLSHHLYPAQERSIAAMVATQADKVGLTTENYIKTFPHEVNDTVQAIAQYDRNNGFLNSPMIRTLNLAFFPMRFELKVATAFVTAISKQPAMTQFALIKGMFNAKNFIQSPQGQAWYAQNADVIGLAEYFSPLDILSTVSQVLGTHGDSIGAYGELGGLPFGWITQTLDAAGLTHFGTSQPLVENKTGEVLPVDTPVTNRGRLQLAIEDFISGLFTYPGAQVGLPSKTSITKGLAKGIVGGQSTDFQATTPPISSHQQEYQQVIQKMTGQKPAKPIKQQPTITPTAVPTSSTPITTPLPKTGSGSSTKKKTKAEFTPELPAGENLQSVQAAG